MPLCRSAAPCLPRGAPVLTMYLGALQQLPQLGDCLLLRKVCLQADAPQTGLGFCCRLRCARVCCRQGGRQTKCSKCVQPRMLWPIQLHVFLHVGHNCLHPSKSRLDGFAGSGLRSPITEAHSLDAGAAWVARRLPQQLQGDASVSTGHAQNRPVAEQRVQPGDERGPLLERLQRRGCVCLR